MVDNSCKDGARSVSKMKKTEIGVIPEDWEVLDIQELINKNAIIGHLDGNHGALYPKSHEFVEDGIPYVGANALINGKIDFNKVKYLTKERANTFQKGISYPKDLLFAHNATVGPVAYVQSSIDKLILSTTLTYFRSDESKLKSKYLLYEFQTERFVKQYSSVMSQSTRNQVPITAQRKFNIVLPPLAEQEAIATALSDADAWIDRLEQLIAKKRSIKQGAMQTLLTPKEDWEVKKLGDVCDVRDGTHDSPKYLDSGVKFITSKNIVNNKLDFSDISYISFSDATEINKRSKVDKDDIIMSMIGTIGNAVLIDFEPDFCIKNVALLKPKNISSTFLIQMIKSPYFQNLLNSKMDGGIQKFVSLGVLRDLDFNCPKSLSEQERIATILSDMDAELEALEQQLAKARQIKQGMMQELLTGRVKLV